MDFLDFIKQKKANEQNKSSITEAFKNSDMDRAKELILNVLKKETEEKIVSLGQFSIKIKGDEYTSEVFKLVNKPMCFSFNWLNSGDSNYIYSVSFFEDMSAFFSITGKGKSVLTLSTLGTSIVYFLPLIEYVINTGDFNLDKNSATKLIKAIFSDDIKEGQEYPLYIGALKHKIMVGVSESLIKKTFLYNISHKVNESAFEDMLRWKKEKFDKVKQAHQDRNESPEAYNLSRHLWKEYDEIKKAIKGGARNIEEVQLAVDKALNVEVMKGPVEEAIEVEVNKFNKDPEQVFKELEKYVKMVIKGITPSVILCGAPGVGKTYRVKQILKQHGYHEEHNLCTIKGKCTPRVLYMKLMEYKNKGDVILIDDADGLVGPKAPEEVINILKAALDSTSDDEGRLVSYGVSGPLRDDEGLEIPKKFFYGGSVIVITNYNAGQLDTALRGRSFMQDIHFSTEELLKIVKGLLPAIDKEHLSMEAKQKAYDYMVEMVNQKDKMEVSIRTFGICAKIYESCLNDPDFSEEEAKGMIKEQLKLQADRGGNKY